MPHCHAGRAEVPRGLVVVGGRSKAAAQCDGAAAPREGSRGGQAEDEAGAGAGGIGDGGGAAVGFDDGFDE